MDTPDAIVVGVRDETAADYPAVSRLGRRCANRLLRWETGLRVEDSQCGFRVYPLRLMKFLQCTAGRYGFESEILTRAGWSGIEIVQRAVRCKYDLPDGRVTHFQPWRDTLRAVGMHTRLVARSLFPWPCERFNASAKSGLLWYRLCRGMFSYAAKSETAETVLPQRN